MKQYELVVLLHPDLEIDIDSPIAKLEKLIESSGGKVIKRDNWGKKRLAYAVKHHDFAVYVAFNIQIDPKNVRSLDNSVSLSEEVIRHLLVSRVEAGKRVASKSKSAKAITVAETDEELDMNEEEANG